MQSSSAPAPTQTGGPRPLASMKHVFALVAGSLALGVAALVGTGLLLSNQWHVTAEVLVAAPPDRVHREVENLRQWENWEAENLDDRQKVYKYEGPETGTGATRRFTGRAGIAGYSRITRSIPGEGVWLESALEGGGSTALASITYRVDHEVTRVVWTDTGTLPRITGAFLRDSVETRLKFHMQSSLKRLKERAEAAERTAK